MEKIRVRIEWPDLTFGPVNLHVVVPAWFFYSSDEERAKYFEEHLSLRRRGDDDKVYPIG